jgi:hypothetical protein
MITITPFYPLRVLPSENYFKGDLIYTFGNGISTHWVKYFRSPQAMFLHIPKDESLFCHGMNKNMIMLYWLLLKHEGYKEITPHTSFGKYPPWGFPVDLFPALSLLLRQFNMIRAISPYEHKYYMARGFKKVYCDTLRIDTAYFSELGRLRKGTGVLCMGGDRKVKNIKTIIRACAIAGRKLTVMDNVLPGSLEFNKAFIDNDVFVSSSYMEGYSLGIGEAQAAGMKLCLSDLPTVKSVYEGRALFHEPDDYQKLAENIRCCPGV